MTEITLSEYVGYIFKEIVQARKLSDQASKAIAIEYSKDPILKEFSVPRFKIPEMELSIPVVVSGAKFTTLLQFRMTQEAFITMVSTEVQNGINNVLINRSGINIDISKIGDIKTRSTDNESSMVKAVTSKANQIAVTPRVPTTNVPVADIDGMIKEFYQTIASDLNQDSVDNNSQICFAEIFNAKLQQTNLFADYKQQNPTNQLFNKLLANIVTTIKKNILISSTTIDNLLVTPETNVVRNESSDTSVFTVKAKIIEDGLFVRTLEDGKQMVEFD